MSNSQATAGEDSKQCQCHAVVCNCRSLTFGKFKVGGDIETVVLKALSRHYMVVMWFPSRNTLASYLFLPTVTRPGHRSLATEGRGGNARSAQF